MNKTEFIIKSVLAFIGTLIFTASIDCCVQIRFYMRDTGADGYFIRLASVLVVFVGAGTYWWSVKVLKDVEAP
jgi:hypothetical protein